MGREHKTAAAITSAAGRLPAVQKHKKRTRNRAHDRVLLAGLVARPTVPKSKHKIIYEWTENTDKKKKLEIDITNQKKPSANFSFVPIGNPELTNLCKELSREQGALVYIVSGRKEKLGELSDHVHRLGYHFRTQIVEQAAAIVGGVGSLQLNTPQDQQKLDPIPEDQDEINRQADAAIRDLFPRIPNTDREMIVRHAFQKGAVFNGKPVVGLQEDITLSRRVQLAVVAHIRHTHTRYDLLLRETSWENARKAVESLCLDILVKWRGDEETGRDQLDEVLREIVVIDDSDNESESEDDEYNGGEYEEISDEVEVVLDTNKEVAVPVSQPQSVLPQVRLTRAQKKKQRKRAGRISNAEQSVSTQTRSRKERRNALRKTRKGFKRYKAWQEALSRQQNRRPDCPSPEEQVPTSNIQQVHRSPDGSMNDTSPNFGLQYQAIYAIDNYAYSRSRVSARFLSDASHSIAGGFVISTEPGQQPLPSQRTISLPESSYREQVIIRPRIDNLHGLEHTYGYDSRPIPIRSMQIDKSSSQPGPVGMPGFEDRVIPSIEQAGDLGLEVSPMSSTYGPVMYSQVRYNDGEPEPRLVQNSSKIIYVDDLESQNKRQRILAGDPTHFPGSDYYVRIARTAAPAQHYLSEQPQRRIVNAVDRNDLSMLDNRFERGLITTAGRDCVIIDDEPRFVRVVGRSPEQTSFREQHMDEPQPHRRQRADNQPFLETERPVLVMHAPVHKNERRSDPNQAYLSLVQERAPQPRLAADNSTYFSSLPSHPHCEMNSGLVSYPIISRTRHENNSRFSSDWNESIVSATKSSHQIPKEHIQVENHGINVFRREENRRPPDFQRVSQMEQQYITPESYSKDAGYVPTPTTPRSDAPVYLKNLPRKEDIIVLE